MANKSESQIAIERQNALLARYRRSRVLIVEDSAEARGMIRGFMRDVGVEKIDLASSGQEAVDYIKSHKYDIVLCDYNLGKGKDGQQVLEEARFSGYLSYSSVFMMITAETTLEMVMGALEYQPDNYLSKPFTKNDLTRRLDRAIATRLEYKAIESAFEKKDYERTLTLCEEKIEVDGVQYRALRLKGESLLQLERFEEANALFQSVLDERDLAWARIGLGRSLYEQRVYEQAAEIFTELIKQQPNVVESYDWLARIQIAKGKPRVAQDTLEAAVGRSPKAILRQLELARVALQNRSFLVAEKAYRKAIVLSVDSCHKSPDHYLQYIRSLLVKINGEGSKLEREAFKEAQVFLSRARKEFPNQPLVDFKVNLLEGLLCYRHNQPGATKQLVERASAILTRFDLRQQTALADEYVGTLALVEHFDQAEAYVHELQKKIDKPELAGRLRRRIINGQRRLESDNLNREAMELHKKGQIMDAHGKFRLAVAAEGVSPNLLLNAASICLELAEREDLNREEWRLECQAYLTRLEELDTRDHRYDLFSDLKERFLNLGN